jgi:hypothetical protein
MRVVPGTRPCLLLYNPTFVRFVPEALPMQLAFNACCGKIWQQ